MFIRSQERPLEGKGTGTDESDQLEEGSDSSLGHEMNRKTMDRQVDVL